MIEIKIPTPGESISKVELATWFVSDGDIVEKNQEIAEVESDKATLPLVAYEGGKIHILVNAGETIDVGKVACTIDPSFATKPKTDTHQEKIEETPDEEPSRTSETESEERVPPRETQSSDTYQKVKITPMAKKLMKESQLSVEEIVEGLRRISSKDVKEVIKLIETEKKSPYLPATTYPYIPRQEERKKMSSLRRKLSERLVAVKNRTAILTTFNEVDMSAVIALRKKYQENFIQKHNIRLGFMSIFTKAVTEALKLYPMVNSLIDGDEIVTPNYADIGIAVQTPRGLMVPVIRNSESLTLAKIEKRLMELASKARNGRISLDEMTGSTFTITNGGIFGSMLSTPILNPPNSAILGIHTIVDRPVAINQKVEIRPMMYIALSYDHRIIDGKDSVSFLVKIKELIEQPHKMLFRDQNPDQMLLDL